MKGTRAVAAALAIATLTTLVAPTANAHPGGPPSGQGWQRSVEDCLDDYGFHADNLSEHGHDLVSLYSKDAVIDGKDVVAFFLTMSGANKGSLQDYTRRETIDFDADGTRFSTTIETTDDESFTVVAGLTPATINVRIPNAYHVDGGERVDDGPDGEERVAVELGYTHAQLGVVAGSRISGWEVRGIYQDGGWVTADTMPSSCPADNVRFVSSGYTVDPRPPAIAANVASSELHPGRTIDFAATVAPGAGTPGLPAWDFGDGNTASGATVGHQYASAGTYTVTTSVTDSLGLAASNSVTVTIVDAPPSPKFTFAPTSPQPGETVTFTDESTFSGAAATYHWTFGDGATSSERNPTQAYSTAGLKTVQLKVTDDGGRSQTRTAFIKVREAGAPPSSDTSAPTAAFASSPAAPKAGQAVTFADLSSDDTGVVAWAWSFGDGGTSSQQNPSHTYAQAGVYEVELTVADAAGQQTAVSKNVQVAASGGPAASNPTPKALFTAQPSLARVGDIVTFTDQSTDDGAITAWAWTFGDGQTSDRPNPRHQYAEPGSYQVRLIVTDDQGATGVFFTPVRVVEEDNAADPIQSVDQESPGLGIVVLGVLAGAAVALRRKP